MKTTRRRLNRHEIVRMIVDDREKHAADWSILQFALRHPEMELEGNWDEYNLAVAYMFAEEILPL